MPGCFSLTGATAPVNVEDSPCRYTGRAAGMLAEQVATQSLPTLRGRHCKKTFYGGNGIHIDPYGNVFSGTCSGIVIGNVNDQSLEKMWLSYEPTKVQMVETLFDEGPVGLLNQTETAGYKPLLAYADKCHLCTDLRQFLFERGRMPGVVGPGDCYDTDKNSL